jgi:hypothetical protein
MDKKTTILARLEGLNTIIEGLSHKLDVSSSIAQYFLPPSPNHRIYKHIFSINILRYFVTGNLFPHSSILPIAGSAIRHSCVSPANESIGRNTGRLHHPSAKRTLDAATPYSHAGTKQADGGRRLLTLRMCKYINTTNAVVCMALPAAAYLFFLVCVNVFMFCVVCGGG